MKEMRVKILPDDGEVQKFSDDRHNECILSSGAENGVPGNGASIADSSVLAQLNENLAKQNDLNEENLELCRKENERKVERDEAKKDRTRKFTVGHGTCCKWLQVRMVWTNEMTSRIQ